MSTYTPLQSCIADYLPHAGEHAVQLLRAHTLFDGDGACAQGTELLFGLIILSIISFKVIVKVLCWMPAFSMVLVLLVHFIVMICFIVGLVLRTAIPPEPIL